MRMTTSTVQTEKQLRLEESIIEGNDFWRDGKFKEMLAHYLSVRKFFDESEPRYLRQCLINLGIARHELGQYEQAVDAYAQALEIEDEKDASDIAACQANYGDALLNLGRLEEARNYLNEAESYFEGAYEHISLAEVLETRARVYLAMGEYYAAVMTVNRAMSLLLGFSDLSKLIERGRRTLDMCIKACQDHGIFYDR